MKKLALFTPVLIMVTVISCKARMDVAKEKEDIIAVIENEKEAYFNQDYSGISEAWIQEPSSYKIYMNENGNILFDGWDAISKHDQENLQDTSWDRSQVRMDFSNYRINVIDNTAWVLFDCHNNGIVQGDTISILDTRIYVLKKVEGNWKFSLMAMTVY